MVCWDGSCSCAETSCTVRCSQCRSITKKHLQRELCAENMFGLFSFLLNKLLIRMNYLVHIIIKLVN